MNKVSYGFVKSLPTATFNDAVAQVTEALKGEGFGVLTEIDVTETLKKKLGVDFRPYVILGACNPTLAHKALSGEPHIGLLLPCNVVVQQSQAGGIEVSIADPNALFGIVDNADVKPIAEEVRERLARVMDAIG